MNELSREDRLKLLEFVCSFAWTDLRVSDEERHVVRRMVTNAGLGADERQQVEEWLERPPAPEEVDPLDIPLEHRRLFYDSARQVLTSDGLVPGERDTLAVFAELLRIGEEPSR